MLSLRTEKPPVEMVVSAVVTASNHGIRAARSASVSAAVRRM